MAGRVKSLLATFLEIDRMVAPQTLPASSKATRYKVMDWTVTDLDRVHFCFVALTDFCHSFSIRKPICLSEGPKEDLAGRLFLTRIPFSSTRLACASLR